MIFVTVGTELPFDRLVSAVDDWAGDHPERQVFAQIGESRFVPRNIEYRRFLAPAEFNARFRAASAIVAHAGMGTILSALRYGRPLLVMPRRATLGEHRNDHQLATAREMMRTDSVRVALNGQELAIALAAIDGLRSESAIGAHAQPSLLAAVRRFIHDRTEER